MTTAAKHRALDGHRRASTVQRALPKLVELGREDDFQQVEVGVTDDRLRLVFTGCHPALSVESQVALTLRVACGLSTDDLARLFLVPNATMAARVTRAKQKITNARIPYELPSATDLRGRVNAVLEVVYLVFTAGHTAPSGSTLMRRDLAERARELASLLRDLMPAQGDVVGLLAPIRLTHARRDARVDPRVAGASVRPGSFALGPRGHQYRCHRASRSARRTKSEPVRADSRDRGSP